MEYRLKFYADSEKQRNKLFCFQIWNEVCAKERLAKVAATLNLKIKAAYVEKLYRGSVIYNKRIQ